MKIITILLNNSIGFNSTFISVKSLIQHNEEVEWFIKDGLSNEEDLRWIKKQIASLPRTQLISCHDNGIYDAMNQALEYVNEEEMVLFLNSGDKLSNSFLTKYNKDILYNFDIIFSDTLVGKYLDLLEAPKSIDFAYLISKTINHQSLIIKGSYLKKYKFKIEYSIVADWVQLYEILKNEAVNVKKLGFPICIYEGGGISEKHDKLRMAQRLKFLESRYSNWELTSLMYLSRIRQRKWYDLILISLDSPKRSKILDYLVKLIK